MYCSYWTWTQSGASYFLNTLALAEGTTVEWGRIGAGPRTLLKASPASAVTHWPLGPGRPASVHWKAREKEYDHVSEPSWSAQRCLWLCVMLPPTAVTSDGWEEHEKWHWTDTKPRLQRTECTACQKSLYKSKKCWCWMKNTIWWPWRLAGDLPSPENRPDPAPSTPGAVCMAKIPAGSGSTHSPASQKPALWKLHHFTKGDNLHSSSFSGVPIIYAQEPLCFD